MDITIGVIAKNEERYLPRLIEDIKNQDYPHSKIEVLLIYGESEDATYDIMSEFANEDTDFMDIRIYHNPRRQSTGWNTAIRNFSTDALIRIDAHATIAEDFVRRCVEALEDEYVVGGVRPTSVDSDSDWAYVLYLAEESMFGSSILKTRRHTEVSEDNYVKTLFHGCYRREVFEKVGGFREDLGRTEDNEFHYRVRQAGYRIYCSENIHSRQYIRPNLRGMIKQKSGNGFWVGRTLGICPRCLSVYHFVPLAFVVGIIISVIIACAGYPWLLQVVSGMYISVAVIMSIVATYQVQRVGEKVPGLAILLPVIFFCIHVSYGLGTLIGILSIPFRASREG